MLEKILDIIPKLDPADQRLFIALHRAFMAMSRIIDKLGLEYEYEQELQKDQEEFLKYCEENDLDPFE